MSIHPVHIALGQTFGDYVFSTPRYQRGYTWDEPEVLDFLTDVTKCFEARRAGMTREHFLGGVVAVEEKIEGSVQRRCQLIDGQQRVTTFVLLVRALELTLAEMIDAPGLGQHKAFVEEAAKELRKDFLKIRISVNMAFQDAERLTLSEPDRVFFAGILHQPPEQASATRESHRRLVKALDMLRGKAKALIGTGAVRRRVDAMATLTSVLRRDLTIILIRTDTQTDAYRLFQVLNDRGTNLSEGDLLRAVSLEMLSAGATHSEHERVAEIWDEILSDKPTTTEQFLRCYYSSVQGVRPGQSSLFDDFVNAFFPTYTGAPLSRTDSRALTNTITTLRDEYRRFLRLRDGEWPFNAPTRTTAAEKERLPMLVNVLDHELCLPMLLAASLLDEERFRDVVQQTERVAFRYKYVCNAHVTPLTAAYLKQAKAIRDDLAGFRVRDLQTAFHQLLQRKTSDEAFQTGLATRLIYQEAGGNRPLKYFLLTAEYYWRWFQAGAQGKPKCQEPNRLIDAESTTIEHIHPQSAAGTSPLDPRTNELGNLTPLGQPDNDRVANKTFAEKRPIYEESTFQLTSALAELGAWDEAALDARRDELHRFAAVFFTVPAPTQPRGTGGGTPTAGAAQPRPRRGRPPQGGVGS